MENVTYIPKKVPRESEKVHLMRYLVFIYTIVTFCFGLVLLSVGIWLVVDRNFMTVIIGNSLYAAAVYLILIGGIIIFFTSFFGCCGVIRQSLFMIFIYLVILIIISVILILGGILAIAFKAQIGDQVKQTMKETLVTYYGFNYQDEKNRAVTDAWDKAQERLKCCAVTNEGWYLYRESEWFKRFGALAEKPLIMEEDEMRPYVPLSCCRKDATWHYIDQNVCQRWRLGPPGSPVVGAINRALYYQGCFDAGYDYLSSNSSVLIGLGIAIGIFLILGIVMSFFLLFQIRRKK